MGAKIQNEIAVSIPFDDIDRIEIYQNVWNRKTRKRLPLSTIMKKTGADYGINGTLYSMRDGKPVCPLKYDSEVLFTVIVDTFGITLIPTVSTLILYRQTDGATILLVLTL